MPERAQLRRPVSSSFGSVSNADGCTLAWTHASHAANDDQPRDREVDRAVARIGEPAAVTEQ